MPIRFLTLEEVMELHRNGINDFGGSLGLRSKELLISAIETPSATFDGNYLHESLASKAAAYYYHISQNQPFVDGNKRAGFLSMFAFLHYNGFNLTISDADLYPHLDAVAKGNMSKEELTNIIELNISKKK